MTDLNKTFNQNSKRIQTRELTKYIRGVLVEELGYFGALKAEIFENPSRVAQDVAKAAIEISRNPSVMWVDAEKANTGKAQACDAYVETADIRESLGGRTGLSWDMCAVVLKAVERVPETSCKKSLRATRYIP